jgi:hypothetical protein
MASAALALAASSCSSQALTSENSGRTEQAFVSHGPLTFGVRCEDDYQNNWQVDWNNNGMCNNFNYGIPNDSGDLDQIAFYYNNHDDQPYIQKTSDTCFGCGGADTVDFFMVQCHGNNTTTDGLMFLWNQNVTAKTSQMRLGDNGSASVFAAFSCSTMPLDSNFFARWDPPFAGGLKIALGAYDLVYNGNDQKGTELASRLENGEAVGFSWNEAVWYADNSNHPLSVATGANSSDCANRHGATLGTMQSLGRLRDGAIGYMCWTEWN